MTGKPRQPKPRSALEGTARKFIDSSEDLARSPRRIPRKVAPEPVPRIKEPPSLISASFPSTRLPNISSGPIRWRQYNNVASLVAKLERVQAPVKIETAAKMLEDVFQHLAGRRLASLPATEVSQLKEKIRNRGIREAPGPRRLQRDLLQAAKDIKKGTGGIEFVKVRGGTWLFHHTGDLGNGQILGLSYIPANASSKSVPRVVPDAAAAGFSGRVTWLHPDGSFRPERPATPITPARAPSGFGPRALDDLPDLVLEEAARAESAAIAAEPVAALIFNFVWVVVSDRRPDAYNELMRVASRASATEDEAALQFNSRLKRLLRNSRATVRALSFAKGDLDAWRPVMAELLDLVSRPVLTALSPAYRQGSRLDDVIKEAIEAFGTELSVDLDPVQALRRLSELDAVRILTIHKCKGLEFEKVVVLGVEKEFFRGDAASSEFFVAISRAKNGLVLTHVDLRARPSPPVKVWREYRTAYDEFLNYAVEGTDDEE